MDTTSEINGGLYYDILCVPGLNSQYYKISIVIRLTERFLQILLNLAKPRYTLLL
jgi:hypothetical protein